MLHAMARMLRRLRAIRHVFCGWVAYRCGRPASARRHFERVLCLGGDEFTAYVHLGRISLGEGDYAGYRREMNNARACDPQRFARMRPEFAGLEPRSAGTPQEEAGERATWRSVRPGGQGFVRRAAVRSAELPTELGEPRTADPFDLSFLDAARGSSDGMDLPRFGELRSRGSDGCDDFSSAVERARFQKLPPIAADEVRGIDLDELGRRLLG